MTHLPPELETLIEHAREGHGPDAQAKQRVRAALATSLVAGATVAATTATAKGMSPVILSLLLAGGGVAAVGVATVAREWSATHDAAPRAPHAMPSHVYEQRDVPTAPTMPVTPPVPRSAIEAGEAATEARPPTARSHPPRPHHATHPALDPISTLAGELELVRSATTAINEQRWSDAIDWLDQHASQFPAGALAQERSGLRALSLCKLGRPDGAAAAARFVRAYPESPMIERLRASCPGLP